MTRSVFNHRRGAGSDYRTQVLNDGPLLYWRLGEASGATAEDETANNRDGTYTNDGSGRIVYGGTGSIANDLDTSIRLVVQAGDIGRVRRAASTDWDNAAFTIEQWVKIENAANETNFMHMAQVAGASNPNNWRWVLCLRGNTINQPLQVRVKGLTSSGLASANTGDLTAQVWYHVVLTWDGTDYVFYLDGSSIGTVTASAAQKPQTSVTNQPFVVGSDDLNTAGDHFEGRHDEVALYDYALAPGRIAAHYAAAL